jgi:hypothetical protein
MPMFSAMARTTVGPAPRKRPAGVGAMLRGVGLRLGARGWGAGWAGASPAARGSAGQEHGRQARRGAGSAPETPSARTILTMASPTPL